jgi:phosphate transport system substrate-binding protein
MQKRRLAFTHLLSAGMFAFSAVSEGAEFHRGYISIVGSSVVEPFAKAVGEKFSKGKRYQTPLLQSSGTGGGVKLFCEGLAAESPDVVLTSRPLKPKEVAECKSHGVDNILQLQIGYTASVFVQAKSAPPLALSRSQLRDAAAKWLAAGEGEPEQNPHKFWRDIDSSLPASRIEILGPPAGSGGYDAFIELISDPVCKARPWVSGGQSEPTADMLRKCRAIRDDGVYKEGRENDESHIARLMAAPNAVAMFDYGMLAQQGNRLRAIPIDGVEPSPATIAAKTYPAGRPLYVNAKQSSIIGAPGLKEYLAEFANENAWGEKGYLQSLGLIVMSPADRARMASNLKAAGISPSTAAAGGSASTRGGKTAKATKSGGQAKKSKQNSPK